MKTVFRICIVIALVYVVFRIGAAARSQRASSQASQQISFDTSPPASRQSQAVASSASADPHWEYDSEDADAGARTIVTGCIRSDNMLHFNWPYHDSYAQLCLKSDGTAYIAIDEGQILSGDDHSATVRIATGRPRSYDLEKPSDYRSTAAFIAPASRIFAAAKKAKNISVEVTYYEAGDQTATFSPREPLDLK